MTPSLQLAPPVRPSTHCVSLHAEFVSRTRTLIEARLAPIHRLLPGAEGLASGKMLRTRLVGRMAELEGFDSVAAMTACAATELVHSASLCHDDIIDESSARRGAPTLWNQVGIPGAILGGDMLMILAFGIAPEAGRIPLVKDFGRTLMEVCNAEMQQEMTHRGHRGDAERWEATCRRKTGALFGFPMRWACPDDPYLTAALGEAGYLLGTAYQMFDDLLDQYGDLETHGKDVGADARRGKHTFPESGPAVAALEATLVRAVATVAEWRDAAQAVDNFIRHDLRPLFHGVLRAGAGR